MAKVLSIQISQPTTVRYRGRLVTTSIFKKPVDGPVQVNKLGILGDTQSDLMVHGGVNKAIYAYPFESYQWWNKHYPQFEYNFGAFGENLTISGLLENEINIDDTFKIGTVTLKVTQPRSPCFKLGVKFNDPKMTSYFYKSKKFGFYLKVLEEGLIKPGDDIRLLSKGDGRSIAQIVEEQVAGS
ncbi:MAG: MOSC domain-containing protein [Fulvivirga sp.]|uniref:MOSC domain-containing protein n=1 Tax=Fulvivirga sp. TaxID=1931237 RepID=UPI0032EAEC7D